MTEGPGLLEVLPRPFPAHQARKEERNEIPGNVFSKLCSLNKEGKGKWKIKEKFSYSKLVKNILQFFLNRTFMFQILYIKNELNLYNMSEEKLL